MKYHWLFKNKYYICSVRNKQIKHRAMKKEFINKVISEVNNTWVGNYEAKEDNGLIVVFRW